jgi:hypothetical protein
MKWYVAHAIMLVRYKDGNQNNFPLWENMILLSGDESEDLFAKAAGIAQRDEGDSQGSYTCDDRPAEMVFAGIRKIIRCRTDALEDGTELTYSQLEVKNKEDLQKLIDGKEVAVIYEGEDITTD